VSQPVRHVDSSAVARDPNPTSAVSAERTAQPRLALVPKEHGASFMSVHSLLLGTAAGFAAGGDDWAGFALAVGFGLLFLPLTAAISVITQPRLAAVARRRALVLGVAFATLGVLALAHGPITELVSTGAIGLALIGAYGLARKLSGPRSVPSQLGAIASICLLAPLAWLLIAGGTDRWPLSAVAAFLSFGGTVPYVRERVRRRRFPSMTLSERLRGGSLALAWQVATLLVAFGAAAAGLVHWLVPIAFLPGAMKTVIALLRPETRPPIRRIGYLETAISTVFALLAGIGLGIAP
jgi:hypothetical protein